jgi:hypothetical protein
LAVAAVAFLVVRDPLAARGFVVFLAPPELDTVTPAATSTVDDEGD